MVAKHLSHGYQLVYFKADIDHQIYKKNTATNIFLSGTLISRLRGISFLYSTGLIGLLLSSLSDEF